MRSRHPALPQRWLMTDERTGESLWMALEGLPRGSGVVFRHYATPLAERRRLFARVARIAQRRRLVLVRAGADRLGRGEAGVHGWAFTTGLRTMPAHSRRELVAARRMRADAVFVSPVFATRSHPGSARLGRARFGLLIADAEAPVIALGGMDERRFRSLPRKVHGWAAIDAWSRPRRGEAAPSDVA